jgi:hypothetical protein
MIWHVQPNERTLQMSQALSHAQLQMATSRDESL